MIGTKWPRLLASFWVRFALSFTKYKNKAIVQLDDLKVINGSSNQSKTACSVALKVAFQFRSNCVLSNIYLGMHKKIKLNCRKHSVKVQFEL